MRRQAGAKAHARVGLLGNPSDAYGGKAIAFSLGNFTAEVELEAHDRFEIESEPGASSAWPSLPQACRELRETGCQGEHRLVRAAVHRFDSQFPELASLPSEDPRARFRLRYRSSIPRQVGLAGSSAIVIAALRALLLWFDLKLSRAEIAELALAAEVEDLGIAAGPMDRVIQSYEGVLRMDFAEPRDPSAFVRIDADSLPPLFVAWDPNGGEASGIVHGDVRERFERGDPAVVHAMKLLPKLVDQGTRALERGDRAAFAELVDRNFDTRASIWTLSERDLELVAIGRRRGHAVKLCGSGGAVVGVLRDVREYGALEAAYRRAGYRALRPDPTMPGL